jgi:alkaline phosphatase
MKKTVLYLIFLFLATCIGTAADGPQVEINKIILMIPDGFSVEGTTLVRWMNDGRPLAWDPYVCGLVRTYAVGVLITDSAPAGTAYATGHKASPGFIGVMPDEEKDRPGHAVVAHGQGRAPSMTILEAARLQGRATGVVVTSQVMHATPAAFTAHSPNRGLMDIIAEQQVYNGLDVALGGGGIYLDPKTRTDRQDLWAVLKRNGVTVVRTPGELAAVRKGPVWGIFDGKALTCDKTRDPAVEPSLAEMTSKAIEILNRNEKGFFLMVGAVRSTGPPTATIRWLMWPMRWLSTRR